MSVNIAARLGRAVRTVLLAGLAGVMGVCVSFIVVRHMTREMTMVPRVEPAVIQQVRLLRAWSNELIELMDEYLDRLPMDAKGCPPSARDWIKRTFLARLDDLRARIAEAQHWRDLEAYRLLGAAADRTRNLALHPEDGALRAAVADDIARAGSAVEAYIKKEGATAYLVVPARLPHFSTGARNGL